VNERIIFASDICLYIYSILCSVKFCENVQNLLWQVNYWFGDKDINQTFLKKTLIFGDVDKVYKDDIYNAILLNIKYYIYTNRCLKKKLSFHSLKACLINLYKTEKMIAVRNQRIA
jgi:hypothetical protein